jgi:drug/metabolite transporter (DMT)-like permease
MWGGTAMFAKGVGIPVPHIICVRSLVAAAALLLFLLVFKTPVRVKCAGDYRIMALLGLLLCLHWLTCFQALKISTAAVAILAFQTYPVVSERLSEMSL